MVVAGSWRLVVIGRLILVFGWRWCAISVALWLWLLLACVDSVLKDKPCLPLGIRASADNVTHMAPFLDTCATSCRLLQGLPKGL